jgi:hypothetical protein
MGTVISSAVTIPLSEYLTTAHRPDREYLDGELVERNLGELDHSRFQMPFSHYLYSRETKCGTLSLPTIPTERSSRWPLAVFRQEAAHI